jgi:hypothetical protein
VPKLQQVIVDIHISTDEYIKYYQWPGTQVHCRARDGRSVSFPASLLQRFLLHNGIRGSFVISFDGQGKFSSIKRL